MQSVDISQVKAYAFKTERTLYESVLGQNAAHMSPKPNPAIEWDGLWMDEDGIYYLLECKHFMTAVLS